MNSLKNYETPEVQVVMFSVEDVVLASGADAKGGWATDTYVGDSTNNPY
ncbi:MAG: hypothetical protein J6Q32_03470 [Clostridia bacterium]|nr:hypothetical protein [Clostridia bacterium]